MTKSINGRRLRFIYYRIKDAHFSPRREREYSPILVRTRVVSLHAASAAPGDDEYNKPISI